MRYNSIPLHDKMIHEILNITKEEEFLSYILEFCSDFYSIPRLKLKDGITPAYILTKQLVKAVVKLDTTNGEKKMNQRSIAIKSGETESYVSKLFNLHQYIGNKEQYSNLTIPEKKYRIARICMAMKLGFLESQEILIAGGYVLNPIDPVDAAFIFALNCGYDYFELEKLIDKLVEKEIITKRRKSCCMLCESK
ncbi:hypothetical protein NDGK_02189 [Clostridiales bacterium CHKCI001]|nr:hypothetical protein NDGK_02189 [Clostridiales bacterium CHKCI001]